MRIFVIIIFLSLLASCAFSQERRVKLAVDFSNDLLYSFTTGRNYNLSTASLGVDVKLKNASLRFYGTYGSNTYIKQRADVGNYYGSIRSHFLGGGFEVYFSIQSKTIKPFFNIHVLSEKNSNYYDGYIDNFHPVQYRGIPVAESIYQGHNNPPKIIYGGWFYQSTPMLVNVNAGASFRLVENLRLNISIGYNLNVMNYKYVTWTKNDDRDEMIRKTPVQRKALHSIAGQVGLNYVFSFQKKSKKEGL
jgi:hypothetical protein